MCYLGGGSTHDKLIFLLKEEYAKIGKRISSLVLGRVINKFYFYEKDNYKRYGYSFSTKDKNKIDVFEKGGRDFIVVNKKYSFVVLNPMKPHYFANDKSLSREDLTRDNVKIFSVIPIVDEENFKVIFLDEIDKREVKLTESEIKKRNIVINEKNVRKKLRLVFLILMLLFTLIITKKIENI